MIFSTKTATAQADCLSGITSCINLDASGGCNSPCIRVVVQQGVRNVPAKCQCQESENESGSVPLGQPCQQDSDCEYPGKYCWGGLGQKPKCQSITRAEAIKKANPGIIPAILGGGGCDSESLNTAIGCIPFSEPNSFMSFFLRWAIGLGGGIAFLLVVYSGFIILTSQGNPERLKAGQELLSSAIMGLILLVFATFILRVIGVDILVIPGFSST